MSGDIKMKCPKCTNNQKYKDGMTCNFCGYIFALNPKVWPNITDMAMNNVIRDLSGPEEYYFTSNQLISRLYRTLRKKQRSAGIVGTILFFIVVLVLTVIFTENNIIPEIIVGAIAVFAVVMLQPLRLF